MKFWKANKNDVMVKAVAMALLAFRLNCATAYIPMMTPTTITQQQHGTVSLIGNQRNHRHRKVPLRFPTGNKKCQHKGLCSMSLKLHDYSHPNKIPYHSKSYRSTATRITMSSSDTKSSSSSPPLTAPTVGQSVKAASLLVLIDIVFRQTMKALAISFPSALAGCGVLFASLLVLGERLYGVLSPGAALLAKWLPVFFVPSLVTLPLGNSVGSFLEVVKVASIIIGGFYFTLFTTAGSVVGIKKLLPSRNTAEAATDATVVAAAAADNDDDENNSPPPATPPPPKPFSDKLNNDLRVITAIAGAAAAYALGSGNSILTTLAKPLTSLFLLSTTLASFVFGARLPKKITKVVHPLVTCTSLTWLIMSAFASATGKTFMSILQSYRTGNLVSLSVGGGDVLLFLLGPAVVSLACQMYDRRKLMRDNLLEVVAAIGVSTFGGLFGTAAAVRLLALANPYIRLSLLSRNITSPLAMAIASILGADVSLAVSMVVISGLIGANFGASVLDWLGIKDPVARGLGIGAASHGLGTAAFVNEKDAFPFAAIAMALTASAATVVVSIPFFKRTILQFALG